MVGYMYKRDMYLIFLKDEQRNEINRDFTYFRYSLNLIWFAYLAFVLMWFGRIWYQSLEMSRLLFHSLYTVRHFFPIKYLYVHQNLLLEIILRIIRISVVNSYVQTVTMYLSLTFLEWLKQDLNPSLAVDHGSVLFNEARAISSIF